MSRVSYAMMHPGGAGEMTRAVRDASPSWSTASPPGPACRRARSSSSRWWATRSCITSSSASTRSRLARRRSRWRPIAAVRIRPRELGLTAHPGARVYVLPCIAGHVGADAAGAILAETPYLADGTTLRRRRRDERGDRARRPRPPARRILPDGSGLRGCADLRRPTRRARVRSSACGSIGQRSSRGSGSSARTCGRMRPGSPRPRAPSRGDRDLRLGHRRGDRRAVPGRRDHRRRDRSTVG